MLLLFATAATAEVRGAGLAAQPPRMLAERLAQAQVPGQRQLGYVVVTRPVRQGRLRLALEEVLSMQLDSSSTISGDGGGQVAPSAAPSGAPSGAAAASAGAGSVDPLGLLGLGAHSEGFGCGPGSEDAASSSLGSRASSSSNLRCAGATLVRATTSSTHLADAAAGAPLRLLLAEDNAINMKVSRRGWGRALGGRGWADAGDWQRRGIGLTSSNHVACRPCRPCSWPRKDHPLHCRSALWALCLRFSVSDCALCCICHLSSLHLACSHRWRWASSSAWAVPT